MHHPEIPDRDFTDIDIEYTNSSDSAHNNDVTLC